MQYLNEFEANKMLDQTAINCAKSYLVNSKKELLKLLDLMGYPIVMKLLSPDVQHRSDIGCVFVSIHNKDEALVAYKKIIENAKNFKSDVIIDGVIVQEIAPSGLEVILGYQKDEAFGPVMMVGSGGIYVEVFKDVAWRLLPMSEAEILRMIQETKLYEIIQGARGKAYDLNYLIKCMLSLQNFALTHPEIIDMELNPLILYPDSKEGIAVDALIKID